MSQVIAITGAAGVIGRAIALGLAASKEHEVVLVTRHTERGQAVAEEIAHQTKNPNVRHEYCDVSDKESVAELRDHWRGPLDVLINNAATAPRQREVTRAGIERQFATNVLGYHWVTQALSPVLEACAPSRVINVASYWAGGLDFDDLEFKRRPYDNDSAYRQSKQAVRMLAAAWALRLASAEVFVNSCHPGDANSKLSRDLGFGGHQRPEDAARTPLWLATEDAGLLRTGKYFQHLSEMPCPFSHDESAVERLFEICSSY